MEPSLSQVPYARRYLAGQSLSIFGDAALWVALGIWVAELTGSSGEAGLTFFFLAAPSLAAPVWGTIADRLRRRPVLVVGNLATAAATLSLWAVGGRHQVWLIWAVTAVYGASANLLGAAQSGYLGTLLPAELQGEAQGWLSTAREGLRVVAPVVGAGLLVVAGPHVVATVDAATFVAAAASVASIPLAEPAPAARGGGWRGEVAAGVDHIRRTVAIRRCVVAMALAFTVIGFGETVVFSVVRLGLHGPTTWVAGYNVLMGVGALLGGPTVAPAVRRWGEAKVAATGIVAIGVGSAGLVPAVLPTVAAGAVVVGFGLPWCIAATSTMRQRATPSHLQGRVSASADMLIGLPQTVSIALGAALVGLVGFRWLCVAMAVVPVAAGAWLASRPRTEGAAVPEPGPRLRLGAPLTPAEPSGPRAGGPVPGGARR